MAARRPQSGADEDRLRDAGAETAALRADGARSADGPTMVMESTSRPASGARDEAEPTEMIDAAPTPRPLIDRAGDALARQPRELMARYRRLEEHQRGVLAALVAIGVFLLLVALLSGGTARG